MTDELTELAQEKRQLKSTFTPGFNNELELILEKCFLQNKTKKEHFITIEKLQVELIRLLTKQKRFSPNTSVLTSFKNLAVFSIPENMVGNILNIDFINEKIKFINFFKETKELNFNEIKFFDKTTLESEFYFRKQSEVYDGISYKEFNNFIYN